MAKESEKEVKIRIFLLSITLLSANTAYAGTTFTQLSKSVEIVDMDKWIKERDKALEYARKVKGAFVFTSSTTITWWHP